MTRTARAGKRARVPEPPEIFKRRARRIREAAQGRPILVFMSGGVDSEFVAHCFLAAGVSFTPAMVRYEGGFNDFDIHWAKVWCRDRRLFFVEIPLGLEEFTESLKYHEILIKTRLKWLFNPGLFPVIEAATKAGFVCVTGCRHPFLSVESGKAYEHRTDQVNGLPRWLDARGLRSRYFEYFNSAPIRRAFIRTAIEQAKTGSGDQNEDELKLQLYRQYMDFVPRRKRHGLELFVFEKPDAAARLNPPPGCSSGWRRFELNGRSR